MEKTVRDHILRALNELERESLKRFRNKLNDCKVKEGYTTIPKGQLQEKDPEDLANLILQRYGISYGVEHTVAVLKAIDENQVAADLEKLLAEVNGLSWRQKKPKEEPQSTAEASSSSTSNPQVVSFVDKHREALIERVVHVAPILDGLISKNLLTSEENDIILAEKTPQNRMRRLYECMRQWSASDKCVLYEVLKLKNRPLVRNLEES